MNFVPSHILAPHNTRIKSVAPEHEGSSPYSQQPSNRSLSWARWIHPPNPQPISQRSILIPSYHLRFGLSCGLFPLGVPTRTPHTFLLSPMRATCPAHPPHSPHCATFSILPLLHLSKVQIFPSAPCSQTPSVYALPLMSETKFHTHTKQLVELWFCIY
jgi:hypothetical protein